MSSIATFDAPPVTEMVLGVQFTPVEGYSPAHSGLYWDRVLGGTWKNIQVEAPLETQQETLSPTGIWASLGVSVQNRPPPPRIQFVHESGERMLQLQNTWFVLNWRRRAGRYPTYEILREEFDAKFDAFRSLVVELGLDSVCPNLWETTYVNHIPRGSVWNGLTDWQEVLPGSLALVCASDVLEPETFNANWMGRIKNGDGRLRASVRHVKLRGDDGRESIEFKLSARGPLAAGSSDEIKRCMDLGHDAIVKTFVATTSTSAQTAWGRTS